MTPALPSVLAVIGFAFLIITLTALARRFPVPTPILQVVAGLLVVLLPGSSLPVLDPDIVFFVFLPPILWAAAYGTSFREFKSNLRSISVLAVALLTLLATFGSGYVTIPRMARTGALLDIAAALLAALWCWLVVPRVLE